MVNGDEANFRRTARAGTRPDAVSPERVDTVVVGSGFGASAVACRLAEADVEVCVLERGRAYGPGDFARSPAAMAQNFWDPSEGLYGLFNPWSFRDLHAVVASGLGGGSLIYANVLIRKDREWFCEDHDGVRGKWPWPVQYDALEPFYTRAEEAIGVERYPVDREPYRSTPKTRAIEEAAERLALSEPLDWAPAPLAVSFTPESQGETLGVPVGAPEDNLHGRQRFSCRLCGECDVGCNLGSKNTLDFNYLSSAERNGADIRTLSEVRRIAPGDGGRGWTVDYDALDPDGDGPPSARRTRRRIEARRLVLGAGTIGTTYLLLRNRAALPGLSPALGTRFSGNGDFLAWARSCTQTTSTGQCARDIDPSRGPVITSRMRFPDTLDDGEDSPGRGFYLEDAGWPQFANWVVQSFEPRTLVRAAGLAANVARKRLTRDADTDIAAEVARFLGDGTLTNSTLGVLGMGRDVPDGRMRLAGDGRLDVDWNDETSAPYIERIEAAMRRIAEVLGGAYMASPTWGLTHKLVTVHPLGGCPMGGHPGEGVVDEYGRVFGHDDLYVVDGAALPGPVGANPSLTIAAFAERAADRIVSEEVHGG